MAVELKPCPFCGSPAEMSLDQFFYRRETRCGSQIDAIKKLKEYKKKGVVIDHVMCLREGKGRVFWALRVQFQGFTPRCSKHKCIGRSQRMFMSEADAILAWNGRMDHGL